MKFANLAPSPENRDALVEWLHSPGGTVIWRDPRYFDPEFAFIEQHKQQCEVCRPAAREALLSEHCG